MPFKIFRWFVIWFFSRDKRVSFSGVTVMCVQPLIDIVFFFSDQYEHIHLNTSVALYSTNRIIFKYPLFKYPRNNLKIRKTHNNSYKEEANLIKRNSYYCHISNGHSHKIWTIFFSSRFFSLVFPWVFYSLDICFD